MTISTLHVFLCPAQTVWENIHAVWTSCVGKRGTMSEKFSNLTPVTEEHVGVRMKTRQCCCHGRVSRHYCRMSGRNYISCFQISMYRFFCLLIYTVSSSSLEVACASICFVVGGVSRYCGTLGVPNYLVTSFFLHERVSLSTTASCHLAGFLLAVQSTPPLSIFISARTRDACTIYTGECCAGVRAS